MKSTTLPFRPIRTLLALLLVASATFFSSCNDDNDGPKPTQENIVQVAQGDARFSILAAAITKADLAATLSGAGPFTVFAPTNDAFAKLGSPFNSVASITAITDPGQIAILKDILLYHVVGADIQASDIATGASSQTSLRPIDLTKVSANKLYLTKKADDIFINGSTKIVAADIDASNGKIHAIDNLLAIPSVSVIVLLDFASGPNTGYSLLLDALQRPAAASIRAAVIDPTSNLTVFAPTNDAFLALLNGAPLSSVSDADLVALLRRHVITTGRVFSSDLVPGQIATAAGTSTVTVAASGTGFTVRGGSGPTATITASNMLAVNGVVHEINQVLRP